MVVPNWVELTSRIVLAQWLDLTSVQTRALQVLVLPVVDILARNLPKNRFLLPLFLGFVIVLLLRHEYLNVWATRMAPVLSRLPFKSSMGTEIAPWSVRTFLFPMNWPLSPLAEMKTTLCV